MSRAIKFRVWDFKLSRFRKEQDCNNNESDIITIGLDGSLRGQYYSDHTILQPERYVIQQFTGLFDSAGKEIYEGDVLKSAVLKEEAVAVVVYNEEYCAFLHGENAMWRGWLGESLVLGNIFQNPELLAAV